VKKNPSWLIYHGIILIWGGIGSFAFHASYVKFGHLMDITSVYFMLTYPAVFAFLNIFLEDLNRISVTLNVGDTISQLLAPFVFLGSLIFGFYVEAKG
jgi:hypothetical protein